MPSNERYLMADSELSAAQVAKGSIYLTLQNIISTIIAVLGFAYMARVISTDEMGIIAGLLLLASLIPLISEFGLNSSILKHVSELKGKGESYSSIIVSAATFRIAICLVVSAGVFIAAPTISELLFKTTQYAGTITLLSADIVILSINPLLNNALLGAGKLKTISAIGIASIATRWTSIIVLILLGKGLEGIVLGWITGDIAHLGMLSATILKTVGFKNHILHDVKQQMVPMLKFAWPLYASSIVAFLYAWYDKAIVLASLPLSDLGIYNTTYTAFSILIAVATALGSSLIPFYGMAHGKNDHQAISYGIKRATKYTMLIIFPLTLGLLAAAKPTLTIFAGQQYESGWLILAILALFGLTYGILPAISNILLIYGKRKTILLLSLIPVISSLLFIPLVWTIGLTGLAIMRGASLVFTLLLTIYFVGKLVKIQISKNILAKTLTASSAMAAVIILAQQLFVGTYFLALGILLGAAIYIASIRFLKILDHEDFKLLEQVVGTKLAGYITTIIGSSPNMPAENPKTTPQIENTKKVQ